MPVSESSFVKISSNHRHILVEGLLSTGPNQSIFKRVTFPFQTSYRPHHSCRMCRELSLDKQPPLPRENMNQITEEVLPVSQYPQQSKPTHLLQLWHWILSKFYFYVDLCSRFFFKNLLNKLDTPKQGVNFTYFAFVMRSNTHFSSWRGIKYVVLLTNTC